MIFKTKVNSSFLNHFFFQKVFVLSPNFRPLGLHNKTFLNRFYWCILFASKLVCLSLVENPTLDWHLWARQEPTQRVPLWDYTLTLSSSLPYKSYTGVDVSNALAYYTVVFISYFGKKSIIRTLENKLEEDIISLLKSFNRIRFF